MTPYKSHQFISGLSYITLSFKGIFVKTERSKVFFLFQIILIFVFFIITNFSYRRIVYPLSKIGMPRFRAAHCMTGAPRTLYRQEIYVSYHRQALKILPGDLFVVLQLMNKTEIIHGTVVTCNGPERYNAALEFLSPRKIEWIHINDSLGAKDDRSGYAKWQRCLEHIEEAEKLDGVRYDYIVRSRPDLYFAKDLPTPSSLPNDRILINPYYECLRDIPPAYTETWSENQTLCDYKNFGVSDLFAIIPRALADAYMRVAYISDLPLHVCGERASHPECAIKAALYKANIKFELWPFLVKIMRSAEFCRSNAWNRFNSWC